MSRWRQFANITDLVIQLLESDGHEIQYPVLVEPQHTTFGTVRPEYGCTITISKVIKIEVFYLNPDVGLLHSALKQYNYMNPDFRMSDITDDLRWFAETVTEKHVE